MDVFYNLMITGVAPNLYPTTVYFGVVWFNEEECIELPLRYPFKGEWGEILSSDLTDNLINGLPSSVQIAWTSICEGHSYYLDEDIDSDRLEKLLYGQNDGNERLYTHLVIGMAPFGGLALWLSGDKKCSFLKWTQAAKIEIPTELLVDSTQRLSMEKYCASYLSWDVEASDNLKNNGLPEVNFYNKIMDQYNYRLNVIFQSWNGNTSELNKEADGSQSLIKSIMIKRYDGSFDKTGNYDYGSFGMFGKPQIITIKWIVGKVDYSANFLMKYENITLMFRNICGVHKEYAIDFIIRIDAENKKYELALYRQGLKEPVVIPESAYQLIVFKNKFEDYRSENYNQPRGAWIW